MILVAEGEFGAYDEGRKAHYRAGPHISFSPRCGCNQPFIKGDIRCVFLSILDREKGQYLGGERTTAGSPALWSVSWREAGFLFGHRVKSSLHPGWLCLSLS